MQVLVVPIHDIWLHTKLAETEFVMILCIIEFSSLPRYKVCISVGNKLWLFTLDGRYLSSESTVYYRAATVDF